MIKLLQKIRDGAELDEADVGDCCEFLLDETYSVDARAELLNALATKGETPSEIAAFVRNLLNCARKIEIPRLDSPLMDVCGTGGDQLGLFNISTAVMFVAAACGVRVVKHGNRGITSKCGGADVLEALGVQIELEPTQAIAALEEAGCVFLFAPYYHPAFKAVSPVRKFLAEQGRTTVFNKLGPLLNPANPPFQLAGVFDPTMVDVYGQVFMNLGRQRAWAVHGRTSVGGLDEMSTMGETEICAVEHGTLVKRTLIAEKFGIRSPKIEELRGSDATTNAVKLEKLLAGNLPGAIEDMVLWNSAGALCVAGICADIETALDRCKEVIAKGEAAVRLQTLRAVTNC